MRRGVERFVAAMAAATTLVATGCAGHGAAATRPAVSFASGPPPTRHASLAAVPAISLPPVAGRFSHQLGGAYPAPTSVSIVDSDHTAAPAPPGIYSICYINAYQAQPEQLDWWKSKHAGLLLRNRSGNLIIDAQWDEALFDVSTAAKRIQLATVIGPWIDGCATRGYRAVEADNLDSYTRSQGRLSASDALSFATQLVERARNDRLAMGQKNAPDLATRARQIGFDFDFAITEECQVYSECDRYTAAYGKHLIEIEYTDQPVTAFTTACALRAHTASVVLRDRNVTPPPDPHHVERWCP